MPRLEDADVWAVVAAYLPNVGMALCQKDMTDMETLNFPDYPEVILGKGLDCWIIGTKNRVGRRYVDAFCPLSSYDGNHGDHMPGWRVPSLEGLWRVTSMPGYAPKKRTRAKKEPGGRLPAVMEIGAPVITGTKDGPAYVGRCVEVDEDGRCLRIETPFGFADARPLVADGKGFVSVPSDRLMQGWAGVWRRQTLSPSAETLRGYYGAVSIVTQEELKQAGYRITKAGRVYNAKTPLRQLAEETPVFSGAEIARLAMEFAAIAKRSEDAFAAWFCYCWTKGVKARWRDALAFETIFREMQKEALQAGLDAINRDQQDATGGLIGQDENSDLFGKR